MEPRLIILAVAALLIAVIAATANHLSESELSDSTLRVSDSPAQWELPKVLREASGLAILDEHHLLLHNDELSNIYRVAISDHSIKLMLSIGQPPLDKDLEGIAVDIASPDAIGAIYLITSTGELLIVKDAASDLTNQTVTAVALNTGLKSVCEIEGLHLHQGLLLAPCKTPLVDEHRDKLVIFSIHPSTGELKVHLRLDRKQLPQVGNIRPTAIATRDSDYYIISTNRLIVYNETNDQAKVYKLPKKIHFQPEGITVLPDGSIYIVDDNRKGIGTMTYYSGLSELKALN